MRKILFFILILSMTAVWLIACGSSKSVTTPSFTSNFAFIRYTNTALSMHRLDQRGVRMHTNGILHARPAVSSWTDSVVMMRNDGTGETTLGSDLQGTGSVQLSLDGKKGVSMELDNNGYMQIYFADLSNLNKVKPVQLTTSLEDHYYPQLSPDNTKVLFMKYSSTAETGQAYTVSTSGGVETMISTPGIFVNYPTYTSDGKHIVFEEEDNDTIDIMNADGTGVKTLTNLDGAYYDEFPSVSTDGKTIVFSRYSADESTTGENIYSIKIDGTGLKQLTTDGTSWDPLFVNDKVVYCSSPAGNSEIYAMNPDGSGQKNLTNTSNSAEFFIFD